MTPGGWFRGWGWPRRCYSYLRLPPLRKQASLTRPTTSRANSIRISIRLSLLRGRRHRVRMSPW